MTTHERWTEYYKRTGRCTECRGLGRKLLPDAWKFRRPLSHSVECPACKGSGEVADREGKKAVES